MQRSRVRIALVTDAWEPQLNGVVRTLRHTIEELRVRGHEVHRISPEQFRTVPCPSYPTIRLALWQDDAVRHKLTTLQAERVHIATEGPLGVAARNWCVDHRRRFTTSYHTQFPEYLRARWPIPRALTYAYLRWFHQPASRVMVATPSLKETLGSRGFRRLALWSRGVETSLFRPVTARPSTDRPTFVYLGRVSVEKNVEAFLSLDLPGHKLVIGEGPALATLKNKYPQVTFAGALHGETLAARLAASDVLVFPSLTDTFGLVMLEAMACGVPVAAFPVTGPKDVVLPGVTGCLDSDLRRAALAALTLNREDCIAFAREFSWTSSTNDFLNLLTPTVRASRKRTTRFSNAVTISH